MSSDCTGANETDFTTCLTSNVTINGINCTVSDTQISIANLNHSAVKGTVESETSSGSSSGGGGGSSFTVTQPEAPTQTTEPEVSAKEELQKKIMALKDKFIIE